jgi:hypothetical protein
MPRNPPKGRFSDDVKVCIGFYHAFLFSAHGVLGTDVIMYNTYRYQAQVVLINFGHLFFPLNIGLKWSRQSSCSFTFMGCQHLFISAYLFPDTNVSYSVLFLLRVSVNSCHISTDAFYNCKMKYLKYTPPQNLIYVTQVVSFKYSIPLSGMGRTKPDKYAHRGCILQYLGN